MSDSAAPPLGTYDVHGMSPDGTRLAAGDERILSWLRERNIEPSSVYRVRLYRRGAWVFRFDTRGDGPFRNAGHNEAALRLPKWVWS